MVRRLLSEASAAWVEAFQLCSLRQLIGASRTLHQALSSGMLAKLGQDGGTARMA